jgi:hypothetical protein
MTKHVKPPTAHHYVPIFLSRRFVDANGRLHFFDKSRAEKGLLAGKPQEVFKQRHLNSIVLSDGRKNPEPETKFFGPLDDIAAELVERIVSAARLGKTPRFTPNEKEAWDFFFFHQWKRAPDTYYKMGMHATFDDDLKVLLAEYERDFRPLTPEERALFESEAGKDRIKHNASVTARTGGGDEVLRVLGSKGLGIARITHAKKSFVIGSSSVAKLTFPDRAHLGGPDC